MPFDSTVCPATSDLSLILCIYIVYNYHSRGAARSPRSVLNTWKCS